MKPHKYVMRWSIGLPLELCLPTLLSGQPWLPSPLQTLPRKSLHLSPVPVSSNSAPILEELWADVFCPQEAAGCCSQGVRCSRGTAELVDVWACHKSTAFKSDLCLFWIVTLGTWLNHPNLFSPDCSILCRLRRKVKVGSCSTMQTCLSFAFILIVALKFIKHSQGGKSLLKKKNQASSSHMGQGYCGAHVLPLDLHSEESLWEWLSSLSNLVIALLRAQVLLIWRIEGREGILGNELEELLPLHVTSSHWFLIFFFPNLACLMELRSMSNYKLFPHTYSS